MFNVRHCLIKKAGGTLEKKSHVELWPQHTHEMFMYVLKHVYMCRLTPLHAKNIQHSKVVLANE